MSRVRAAQIEGPQPQRKLHTPCGVVDYHERGTVALDGQRSGAKGADGERIVSRAICMLPCFELGVNERD